MIGTPAFKGDKVEALFSISLPVYGFLRCDSQLHLLPSLKLFGEGVGEGFASVSLDRDTPIRLKKRLNGKKKPLRLDEESGRFYPRRNRLASR